MADVSFIIPHKGRDDMLLETLQSIANLDTSSMSIEVIVVSQNEQASKALSDWKSKLPLTILLNVNTRTISASRNLGVSKSSGHFLAFLDADIALANNWLQVMIALLKDPKIVLASAMQVNSEKAPPLERIRTALSNAHLDTNVTFLPGRNLFLSAQTFHQVHGFPEHLITCEDYYFTERVAQTGHLYYTSKTQYVHIGEDKYFAAMFRKEIWRGQSNLSSIKGRHVPLQEWPSFFVPVVPIFFLFAAVLFFALGYTYLAISSLFMTVLPVLLYAVRLKWLAKSQASLFHCVLFYLVYFPARAIGTVMGLLSDISTSSHN